MENTSYKFVTSADPIRQKYKELKANPDFFLLTGEYSVPTRPDAVKFVLRVPKEIEDDAVKLKAFTDKYFDKDSYTVQKRYTLEGGILFEHALDPGVVVAVYGN